MNAVSPIDQTDSLRDALGRPLHDLRISVIETCNFRCPYCMPAEHVPDDDTVLERAQRLSFDEIERTVRAFVALGVRKVRLTGGEPLLRKHLPDLVARLAAVPGIEDLALTTNGALLARQASALREAGLDRLTISIDSLDPSRFQALTGGRGDLDAVLAGLASAEAAGFADIKINCVVQRGVNDADVLALVERFRRTGHVVRFIEFMDVGSCNGWRRERVVPSAELRDRIHARWPLRALSPNYRGEVADRYAFVDGAGEVGFVSSVSEPFCGDCHRARLSADGRLFTCLFADNGADLRPWLREDGETLVDRIAGIWRRRGDRYSEQRARYPREGRKIEMYLIGG